MEYKIDDKHLLQELSTGELMLYCHRLTYKDNSTLTRIELPKIYNLKMLKEKLKHCVVCQKELNLFLII